MLGIRLFFLSLVLGAIAQDDVPSSSWSSTASDSVSTTASSVISTDSVSIGNITSGTPTTFSSSTVSGNMSSASATASAIPQYLFNISLQAGFEDRFRKYEGWWLRYLGAPRSTPARAIFEEKPYRDQVGHFEQDFLYWFAPPPQADDYKYAVQLFYDSETDKRPVAIGRGGARKGMEIDGDGGLVVVKQDEDERDNTWRCWLVCEEGLTDAAQLFWSHRVCEAEEDRDWIPGGCTPIYLVAWQKEQVRFD